MRKTPYFDSSDLSTILHSKRANLYYLEYCRVLVNGGRVEYVTNVGKESLYFNIPIANTTCIMLGIGTSITHAAVRDLSKAGVMIGFAGNGGTPLLSGTEAEIGCDFFSPQSEYRPTEYLQKWCGFWFDDAKRLLAAKFLQKARLQFTLKCWAKHEWAFEIEALKSAVESYRDEIDAAENTQALLLTEGRLTKRLYHLANKATLNHEGFRRDSTDGDYRQKDPTNRFLDHGNYLAYGLGATATWVLGLPHGLSILHGKTRRGGLVFDAADIIKDGIVLPMAFISALEGDNERAFRERVIAEFRQYEALDMIFDTLKAIAELDFEVTLPDEVSKP